MMHITLPCVIAITMNSKVFPLETLWLISLGALCNIALLLSCLCLKKDKLYQATCMISVSGFNIGCFALPLVNGLFHDEAMLALCMFDLGNAVMCLGMNADIAKLRKGEPINIQSLLQNTLHSCSVWTYLIMLLLCLFRVSLPSLAVSFMETAGNANPLLAMLSIGMAMNLHIKHDDKTCMIQCVIQRAGIAILMATAMQFLPISVDMRNMLTLLCLSPISAVSPVFAKKLHLHHEVSANINSIYMFVSMFFMCGYMLIFL